MYRTSLSLKCSLAMSHIGVKDLIDEGCLSLQEGINGDFRDGCLCSVLSDANHLRFREQAPETPRAFLARAQGEFCLILCSAVPFGTFGVGVFRFHGLRCASPVANIFRPFRAECSKSSVSTGALHFNSG